MNSFQDVSPVYRNFRSFDVKDGMLKAETRTKDPYFWVIWGGFPGATPIGRDGVKYPMNLKYYTRLTIKMWAEESDNNSAQIYWFYSQNIRNNKVHAFKVVSGWHIYQIRIPSFVYNRGKPIGFRIDPINRPRTRVMIDWIRLTDYNTNKRVEVKWTDYKWTPTTATVYADPHSENNYHYDGYKLATVTSKRGYNSETINLSGLKPDKYHFYIKRSYSKTQYSQPIEINQAPYVKIYEPGEDGGHDWATVRLRNAWNMNDRGDIAATKNITSKRFSRGVFTGVNSRPVKNDPHMLLRLRRRGRLYSIDTSRYRFLTFKMTYSGSFDLVRGTMTRLGWKPAGHGWQMSDDFVVYPRKRTYTLDLKKTRTNVGRYGWRGRVTAIRFDPHEDPFSRRFYIDSISIKERDKLSSSFNIRWRQSDSNDRNHRITFYRDRDRHLGNGNEARITTNRFWNGTRRLRWSPSRRIRGTYYIHARISDHYNTGTYTSPAMLKVH